MIKRQIIRWVSLVAIIISVLLCLTMPATPQEGKNYSARRHDAWRVLGPGGGGAQFYPAVSPHDPNLVLVACDMTGAYISEDGGGSWRMFNLRHPVNFFAFDPVDANVIYAGAGGLWRSSDRGGTWKLVYPPSDSVIRLVMPDDHASPSILSAQGDAGTVSALAIDPRDPKTLFATVGDASQFALCISKDWGIHWQCSEGFAAAPRKIYVDPRSPQNDRTLYVVANNSVNVRRGGKWSRGPLVTGAARFLDASAGFTPSGELTVYAVAEMQASGSGIFVSANAGATWRNVGDALLYQVGAPSPSPDFTSVATCLRHPEIAYISYEGLHVGNSIFHGVAKTGDAGVTWQLVWKEAEKPAPNVHDAWISERFGTDWGEPGISLGVAPNNPDICYRTDLGRTMRTLDGGRTWEAVYSRRQSDLTYVTTGLDVTTDYGVFFDPFDYRRMFIAYTDIGLFRSENAGQSWTSATLGVPRRWTNTTYWITFDPAVKGRVWGVMSYVHDLPRPKMWRRTSPQRYAGGVCISDDGGKSWRPSNQGMAPTAATHILLDPASPADARVLYVTGMGKGVFKSADGGKTWTLKNQGLPAPEPLAWRLARDKNGVLYVVIARRSEDGSYGNAQDGALYRSRDGAEHWEKVLLPQGVNGPNGISIDPDDVHRLYLAVWGRNVATGAVDGGIYVSTDGGATWRNKLARDQHVYDITVDFRDPRILYACGFESSAWRSTDRGETWTRIRGYNFKWGHRVIPDPQNPAMIYVTTFGGSVWYGPAEGDPHAIEDIATPTLAYEK